MKILIIGAGRMGIRHLQGALKVEDVEKVILLDINPDALASARLAVNNDSRLHAFLPVDFQPEVCDICIIASTAQNRKPLIDVAVACGCKYLMIEKPLGQSYQQVKDLVDYVGKHPITTMVNLNMRMYEPVIKLKKDMAVWPQMQGDKTITLNTGTLGIGCNGIHYLDKIFFLLDADDAKILAAEIDERLIPSGRGSNFCDFGGWAVINFYNQGKFVGKLMVSMAADSTAFGGWEIIAPYARIVIDEITGVRRTLLRKRDSIMPLNRYAADFEELPTEPYFAPFLGDLTARWIEGIRNGIQLLPELKESLKAHKLMFEWLSYSKKYKDIYPIT